VLGEKERRRKPNGFFLFFFQLNHVMCCRRRKKKLRKLGGPTKERGLKEVLEVRWCEEAWCNRGDWRVHRSRDRRLVDQQNVAQPRGRSDLVDESFSNPSQGKLASWSLGKHLGGQRKRAMFIFALFDLRTRSPSWLLIACMAFSKPSYLTMRNTVNWNTWLGFFKESLLRIFNFPRCPLSKFWTSKSPGKWDLEQRAQITSLSRHRILLGRTCHRDMRWPPVYERILFFLIRKVLEDKPRNPTPTRELYSTVNNIDCGGIMQIFPKNREIPWMTQSHLSRRKQKGSVERPILVKQGGLLSSIIKKKKKPKQVFPIPGVPRIRTRGISLSSKRATRASLIPEYDSRIKSFAASWPRKGTPRSTTVLASKSPW